MCAALFISVYGSQGPVGFFVEEAALQKIYSIPAAIKEGGGEQIRFTYRHVQKDY